jgi:hypothetical protein
LKKYKKRNNHDNGIQSIKQNKIKPTPNPAILPVMLPKPNNVNQDATPTADLDVKLWSMQTCAW